LVGFVSSFFAAPDGLVLVGAFFLISAPLGVSRGWTSFLTSAPWAYSFGR